MRDPREALEAARKAAATLDAAGERVPPRLERAPDMGQLLEWAIIDPDVSEVYSTRRFGRPITALKRLLIRLLYQYLGQMSAQQSRFNAHLAVHAIRLEGRMNELEEALGSRARPIDDSRSGPGDGSRSHPTDGSRSHPRAEDDPA